MEEVMEDLLVYCNCLSVHTWLPIRKPKCHHSNFLALVPQSFQSYTKSPNDFFSGSYGVFHSLMRALNANDRSSWCFGTLASEPRF
jgi:hypothetical protein